MVDSSQEYEYQISRNSLSLLRITYLSLSQHPPLPQFCPPPPSFFSPPPKANRLIPSTTPLTPAELPLPSLFFPAAAAAATALGVLDHEGGTSNAGFFVKKFLGRNSTVMGSAGMTG